MEQMLVMMLCGAASAALAFGSSRQFLAPRLRVLAALRAVRIGAAPEAPGAPGVRRSARRSSASLRAALNRVGGVFVRGPLQRWAEGCLRGSGLPVRQGEFLMLCVGGLLVGWLLGVAFQPAGFVRLVLLAVGALACPLYARRARGRRKVLISLQLGGVLMTLANGLRAGHSLLQAMASAAQQSAAPLGTEINRLLREISGGLPVEEALQRLQQRTANPDLELMVTAVLVQREVGGNLAEILDKISATIRARVSVQNHLRTVTAQSRLSGWVVGLLPVGVFTITTLVAPQVESLLTKDLVGRVLAASAVLLEVIGLVVIQKVVAVKY